jgi:hypothetical protein
MDDLAELASLVAGIKLTVMLLSFNLDISKAFDSISWPYLLEVLHALAFSQKWRDWISSTSSSKILINGRSGKNIKHARGLRQGDPFSPLLFILAIDPLQRIIEMAVEKRFLQSVLPKTAKLKCSLYADDAAIFSAPTANDLSRLSRILHTFGECSDLTINMAKTEIFPIRWIHSWCKLFFKIFRERYAASRGNIRDYRFTPEN